MTHPSRKRRSAGEPIKDRRKIVTEPPKHGKKAKPKVYLLHVTTFEHRVRTHVQRYATVKAREQARQHVRKQVADDAARRASYCKQPDRYELSVAFAESEE